MEDVKTYTVSAATLNVVTEFLSKQPWAAVNHVFVALNTELAAQIAEQQKLEGAPK